MVRRCLGLVAASIFPLVAFAQIGTNFFGLVISNSNNASWPNDVVQPLTVKTVRLWDSNTRWDELEISPGNYAWGPLDRMIIASEWNNQSVLYTFGGVPSFISSNPNDAECGESNGICDPPTDLNPDGSGSDATFKAFVTALMVHTGAQITYFEVWNEVNNQQFWRGTAAQAVRMAHDARTIIKTYNPYAIVLSPSTCACNNTSFTAGEYTNTNVQNAMAYYLKARANIPSSPTGASLADGISIHPYVGSSPPESIVSSIAGTFLVMKNARVSSLPLIITEDSWGPNTDVPGCSASPPFTRTCLDTASAYVARTLAIAASSGVSAYYWYAWGNNTHGTLYNTNTGMLYETGLAFAQVHAWLKAATATAPCSTSGTVYTCELTWPGQYKGLLVWDTSQNCNSGCTTRKFTVPAGFTTVHDLAGDPPTAVGSTTPIGIKPVLLTTFSCPVSTPICGKS
jgi:hypothetical protein